MSVKEISLLNDREEIHKAFELAQDVFMMYEAPTFIKSGTESFLNFLWGKRVQEMLEDGSFLVWGCYSDGELAGMLALRENSHISLLFVNGCFHRQGIGRMLFSEAKNHAMASGTKIITVNASEFGIPFYKAMGFYETDMQLTSDGIIYTPMAAKIESKQELYSI